MALPASFLDELRTRTPLAAVIGRRVRLARSGRQWKGCCPFHGEKTPSFYVYEDGHYHCFGCGAHGDAIGFVMQSEGAGFMEAVERLAAEAGLDVPKPSPEAAEAERRRHDLASVLEAAQASYHRRLFLPEGRRAWTTCSAAACRRQTIRRFGLGWSGEGRGALAADLARDGVTEDQLVEAGLMRRDDETGRGLRSVLQSRDVPDPRPPRPGHQLRRPHPWGRPAEIRQRAGDGAVFQAPHPLRARSGARGGARRRASGGGRGLYGRDRPRAGRFRRRRGAARNRADRGTAGGAVAARARADPVLRRRCCRSTRRRSRRRTRAAAAGAGAHAEARDAAGRRGSRYAGAPRRARAACRRCWRPPVHWPMRSTT